MGFEMKPGEICSMQRQFLVDGKVAFKMGEEVKIEAIDPDPQRPGFKYLVFSKELGQKVRLRGVDLEHKYCPECNYKLMPGSFKCERCEWVIPGQEQRARAEDWKKFQDRLKASRREADYRRPGD